MANGTTPAQQHPTAGDVLALVLKNGGWGGGKGRGSATGEGNMPTASKKDVDAWPRPVGPRSGPSGLLREEHSPPGLLRLSFPLLLLLRLPLYHRQRPLRQQPLLRLGFLIPVALVLLLLLVLVSLQAMGEMGQGSAPTTASRVTLRSSAVATRERGPKADSGDEPSPQQRGAHGSVALSWSFLAARARRPRHQGARRASRACLSPSRAGTSTRFLPTPRSQYRRVGVFARWQAWRGLGTHLRQQGNVAAMSRRAPSTRKRTKTKEARSKRPNWGGRLQSDLSTAQSHFSC